MSMVQQTISEADGKVTISEEYPDGTVFELEYREEDHLNLHFLMNGEWQGAASIARTVDALRNYD